MPNYEYKCTQDGSRFELWQEVGTPAPPCPACGAPSKKVFSPPRVHFKGSGFYLTDLRAEQAGGKNGTKSASNSEASGSDAESSSNASAATDTKPEAKTESKAEAVPASKPGASSAKTD